MDKIYALNCKIYGQNGYFTKVFHKFLAILQNHYKRVDAFTPIYINIIVEVVEQTAI